MEGNVIKTVLIKEKVRNKLDIPWEMQDITKKQEQFPSEKTVKCRSH